MAPMPTRLRKQKRGEQTRMAITWGYNKDHRPDLKQLLYILTVSRDGAVPLYFQVASGNVVDDQTHRATWDLLCRLTGRPDFLYVADCKLATHREYGLYPSAPRPVPHRASPDPIRGPHLPGLAAQAVRSSGDHIHDKRNDNGEIVDQYTVCEPPTLSVEGYRLVWYHSTRKAEQDACSRHQQVERAMTELAELRLKLSSPRTRYRQEAKVAEAVQEILEARGVERWIVTEIKERTEEKYRQERRGRPSGRDAIRQESEHLVRAGVSHRQRGLAAETCGDGVFPLITNDSSLAELEMLLAYKGQPALEKRFSHLKTDFEVAPVYLKEVQPDSGVALCLFSGALDRVAAGTRAASCHGSRGDRQLASIPRGSQMSPPHGPPR